MNCIKRKSGAPNLMRILFLYLGNNECEFRWRLRGSDYSENTIHGNGVAIEDVRYNMTLICDTTDVKNRKHANFLNKKFLFRSISGCSICVSIDFYFITVQKIVLLVL